ncbi:MAG: ABC transporter permease [Micromonosporaceae bacterium]|nr:ABC transporter permease [Micromonosporaceae bacterium]
MAPAFSVFEGYLVAYRRTWRSSVFASFLLPLLFVVGFGLSVGGYVDARGSLGSVRYLDYIVPGLLASNAMQMGYAESAYPVMGRFQWLGSYHAMAATPLRIVDILAGDLLFVVFRVLTSTAVFLAVASALGGVHSAWAVLVPFACVLLALAFATPGAAFTASIERDSHFALVQRFLVVPLSLFSGVFFPIAALPVALRFLAYASPLWHAVQLCRAATLPGFGLTPLAAAGHAGYLALWVGVGFWLALARFRHRLTR